MLLVEADSVLASVTADWCALFELMALFGSQLIDGDELY